MSEPERPVETPSVRDDDRSARGGAARAVFGGRLRAGADAPRQDGGADAGAPAMPPADPAAAESANAPGCEPGCEPGSESGCEGAPVWRDLIDRPETRPAVWVHHPVTGARLFRLPVELPDGWRATADGELLPANRAAGAAGHGEAVPPAPPQPRRLTAESVLHELARIAFADPLPPWKKPPADGTQLCVKLRDKQTALLHLGRYFDLFSGRRPAPQPFAELSDAELKAKSDEVVRALLELDAREAAERAPPDDGEED